MNTRGTGPLAARPAAYGWLIACCLVLFGNAASAQLKSDGRANVSFTAVGPAGMKIKGESQELSLRVDAGRIIIRIPLAPLDTGITLRNTHMREKYLEVAKYPHAELSVEQQQLTLPASGASFSGKISGLLSLHGQQQPIEVSYTVRNDGDKYAVEGKARLDIRKFGITVPSYLGVTVKPEVDLHVEFHVTGG